MTRPTLLSAFALLAVATSPAFAEPVVTGQRSVFDDEGRLTRTVSFKDLDLATPAGEKILLRRVGSAIRFVCSPAGDFLSEASCQHVARRGARPQIARALDLARSNPALAAAALSTVTISAPAD